MSKKSSIVSLTAASVLTLATALANAQSNLSQQDQPAGPQSGQSASLQTEAQAPQQAAGMMTKTPEEQKPGATDAGPEQTTAAARLDRETVRKAQQALNQEGYSLQVDGIVGPQTRGAVKQFQQDKGLQASGELDGNTLSELGIETEQAGISPLDRAGSEQPQASAEAEADTSMQAQAEEDAGEQTASLETEEEADQQAQLEEEQDQVE